MSKPAPNLKDASPLLRLTPEGALVFHAGTDNAASIPLALCKTLEEHFANSTGSGLLALASESADGDLPAELAFWRMFAREFITQLCHVPNLRDGAWQDEVPAPPEEALQEWMQNAPPVSGMEFLSVNCLRQMWLDMHKRFVQSVIDAENNVESVLHTLHPVWRMVGRVTLHLAENKRDPLRPFAFIATYTNRVNARSEAQHLPLARALNESAERDDKNTLRTLLAPLNAASARSALLKNLIETKRIFQPLAWEPEQAFAFLQDVPIYEDSGLLVKMPDWWRGRRPASPNVQIVLNAGDKRSSVGAEALLGFKVNVALGDDVLTPEEIAKIMASDAPLISLRGKWIEPNRERLQQALNHWHRAAAANAEGVPFHEGLRWLAGWGGAGAAEAAEVDLSGGGGTVFFAGDALRQLLQRMRADEDARGGRLPAGLRADLRPYQAVGLHWLGFMGTIGCGACLADDMGLGKTIQLIAHVLRRREDRALSNAVAKPTLIVAPASLMANWRREFERFAPGVEVVTAHRSAIDSASLKKLGAGTHSALQRDAVLLTTYTTLGKLISFNDVKWDMIVLDEAQAIKNAGTTQARSVKKLTGTMRVALTGTPVENRLGDLWSLFDFLNPGLLGSAQGFAKRAREMAKSGGYAPLRKLVRPFIMRRLKTDPNVAPDLPRKTEMTAFCPLSKKQAQLYQRAVAALARELADAEDGIQRQGVILGALMKLKQICNHPSQWSGDGAYAPTDSGKFVRLAGLCAEMADRQEKVLVFTQFREITAPLSEFLHGVFGRAGLVLHGGTPVGKRGELVEQFQSANGPPFFVISVKAGGTGLNLTAASQVIHFDRWWNPAVEDQATDRAFRIGQTKPVLVHKFVCQGTLEEKIDTVIQEKRALASEVLGSEGDGAAKMLTQMGDSELIHFLALQGQNDDE